MWVIVLQRMQCVHIIPCVAVLLCSLLHSSLRELALFLKPATTWLVSYWLLIGQFVPDWLAVRKLVSDWLTLHLVCVGRRVCGVFCQFQETSVRASCRRGVAQVWLPW